MNLGFLFWLFLGGILIATFQDLKRREVDDWLNLFLLVSSFIFIIYGALFSGDYNIIFSAAFALVVLLVLMFGFYYGRVFSGGDAKLLFAMTVFFVSASFLKTLSNIGIFILFLLISGAIYGLFYSLILYFLNFSRVNKRIKLEFRNKQLRYFILIGIVFFVLSYVFIFFLPFAILFFLLPLLYSFSKGLEGVVMIRDISGKEVREGDWLAKDVRVGKKVVKASWDGVSLEEMRLLKKLKKVKIKSGLPFVPAFLIAFLAYVFLRDVFISFLFGLV